MKCVCGVKRMRGRGEEIVTETERVRERVYYLEGIN
jgi:hypothetical protein